MNSATINLNNLYNYQPSFTSSADKQEKEDPAIVKNNKDVFTSALKRSNLFNF
jgi:hypothetical protein